jgi:hypothetical protein
LSKKGTYLWLQSDFSGFIKIDQLEKVLKENEDIIESHNFATYNTHKMKGSQISYNNFGDYARINNPAVNVYAVQPSVFSACVDDFLSIKWQSKSKLSLGE